ncbi:MAG: glutamate--cysteine ligase [Arsenophonus sp.]|nr:MAG: glutamate--cysteine ligase [Arsenophonus sp.]
MIPDISKSLIWLRENPNILCSLRYIKRGVEREGLRITQSGKLANTLHPKVFGKALTHPWITTDFSESLLEFITPTHTDVKYILTFLQDLYRYSILNLNGELIWPLSMPCFIDNPNNIIIAKYGDSNIGRFKTLYREGLKHRYGSLMQIISGVHYNFSFPSIFWNEWKKNNFQNKRNLSISDGYFNLIRNYYRFNWLIPYLFGTSPAISGSFLQGKEKRFFLKKGVKNTYYLPYATSLRMSSLGYTNDIQDKLTISYNNLKNYIKNLKNAMSKPFAKFSKLGIKNKIGQYIQINTNLLQIENEFYAPIRPKRILKNHRSLIDALSKDGIEYLEIRILDINPFNHIGVDKLQINFLDLFLIWCLCADSPPMNKKEFKVCKINFKNVVLKGRKPGQVIYVLNKKTLIPIREVAKSFFHDLLKIAYLLDMALNTKYEKICIKLMNMVENPELTYSGQLLSSILEKGIDEYGLELAKNYYQKVKKESYQILNNNDFYHKKLYSIEKQKRLEKENKISFDDYLKMYFLKKY